MALSARATVETLAVMAAAFLLQSLVGLVTPGLVGALFVLSAPLPVLTPWTLVTSVYAHAGLGHLLGNAAILLGFGLAVEQVTSRLRFHAFFVTVGALAGLAQVWFGVLPFVGSAGVLGASGAILGLVGYTVAGNDVADTLVGAFELDARAQLAAVGVLAAAVALAMHATGVATVGHFSGLVIGLLAGRMRLLHVDRRPARV